MMQRWTGESGFNFGIWVELVKGRWTHVNTGESFGYVSCLWVYPCTRHGGWIKTSSSWPCRPANSLSLGRFSESSSFGLSGRSISILWIGFKSSLRKAAAWWFPLGIRAWQSNSRLVPRDGWWLNFSPHGIPFGFMKTWLAGKSPNWMEVSS